ncbi:hypothetical protein Pcinc_008016 [Petrolisthes cinctipes]|uniref:Uncharacterized protein n=1 Tax=Petrolisthes cinctipes TaxID=88211 RepID=A0AAE1GA09_PETCI|nr:hypothetical protein Pcinc_008016 [Petrolisthes cinctipes]
MDQEVVASFKRKYYARSYKQLREATDTSFGQALHSVADNDDEIGEADTESEEVLTQLHGVSSAFASVTAESMREVLSSGEKDLTVEEMVQKMEREAASESEGEEELVPRRMNHKDVARVLEQAEILKSLIIEINSDITEGSSEANEVDKLPVIRKYREMYKKQAPTQHHLLLQATDT